MPAVASADAAFLDWLLGGEADGGTCPECGRDDLTVSEFEYRCQTCGFGGDLPEVPGWL